MPIGRLEGGKSSLISCSGMYTHIESHVDKEVYEMIVNDYQDISSMVKTFRRNIGSPLNLQKNASIGHQGAGWDAIFNWSPNIGIWMVADDNAGGQTRYWTAFGIGEPSQTKSNSIIVEINFPRRGIDGRIAGLFWRTENNQILVLHSGKVGGGRTSRNRDD